MARLIDAEKVYELGHRTPFHMGIADLCDLKELLADVPTVDAVEVVRCNDCQKCLIDNSKMELHLCMKIPSLPVRVKLDGFCSYGERKDGDGNG